MALGSMYYQAGGYDTLVVYDRSVNELASGRINGDIITYYPPDPVLVDGNLFNYVDYWITEGRFIKIN